MYYRRVARVGDFVSDDEGHRQNIPRTICFSVFDLNSEECRYVICCNFPPQKGVRIVLKWRVCTVLCTWRNLRVGKIENVQD